MRCGMLPYKSKFILSAFNAWISGCENVMRQVMNGVLQ